MQCDVASRDGSVLTEGLGPLPEADMSHRKALDDCDEETGYSAEAMEAERQRCYALGVAAERERREMLQDMLREVGKWDFRGRSVAETYDMTHGAGSWRRALMA